MPNLQDSDAELATAFSVVARQLQAQESQQKTWQKIVDLGPNMVPGAKHAGISIVHSGGRIETPASTDEIPSVVDALQYETGEGPCLDAIRESAVFMTGDLAKEKRWPKFSLRTVEQTGIHSMLSLRLYNEEDTFGAINFSSDQIDAFDDRSKALGEVLAAHAAVALSAAGEHKQAGELEDALVTSREIGMAVGILMTQTHSDRGRAFRILSEGSQRLNVKVRDLAMRIVATEEENRHSR